MLFHVLKPEWEITIASKMKKKKVPLEKLDFIIVSQTEEVMYCRLEKSYGVELVM